MFRTMRLRALYLHKDLFSANLDEAAKKPDSFWIDTLDGAGKQVFGLFDEETLIGITGVFKQKEDPSEKTGVMGMSFIEPSYRGQGYSSLFYEARIAFARTQPWTRLIVCHRANNESSRRAILRHGFILTSTYERDWPDGTRDIEYTYELDLEKFRGS